MFRLSGVLDCRPRVGLLLVSRRTSHSRAPVDQPSAFTWVVARPRLRPRRSDTPLTSRCGSRRIRSTFSEVPLTLGLVVRRPVRAARSFGSSSASAVAGRFRRPHLVKVVFNAGLFACEVGIAVLVFHRDSGDRAARSSHADGWRRSPPLRPFIWSSRLLCPLVMRFGGAPVTVSRQALAIVAVSWLSGARRCAVALCGSCGALARRPRRGSCWRSSAPRSATSSCLRTRFGSGTRRCDRSTRSPPSSIALPTAASQLYEADRPGLAELLSARRVVLFLPNEQLDRGLRRSRSD